ncbi:PaaX family transcriptional regulator [Virgisporangium aliadipatigenens]|uniref:PaaX family transcriptional regulator n=1 Tax=Virgisporangium aliadipatigenens TaxID=741659 RepID=A0A8J3YT48_9ACTN|nr:PaaX family transcriptional regulator C-terminal domain-containing protein [Virgisporangium aliadipatigenens]GIJ51209.1 PaaX family transcriptional regulator [Virgisporangium aliadipatigenens]
MSAAVEATDPVDLPRMQAGGSPQHLLLTLLGDYWYGQGTPLPSAALVALLGEFGITGVSARAALSRLARRGLLALSKSGRRTAYALSPRAADVLQEGIRHIISFGAQDKEWSGTWTVAAFSVPEDQRDLRHSLRTRLGWHGFASLYDGLWVSPHGQAEKVISVLSELGISTATVFTAQVADGSPTGGHPINAWDLDALRELYQGLIAEYEPVRDRLRAGQVSTAEALVARTALMDAWRNFPNLDPQLPGSLLPQPWPRQAARDLFIELYDGLAWLAEKRVVQVVAQFDADLAKLVRSHTSDFSG